MRGLPTTGARGPARKVRSTQQWILVLSGPSHSGRSRLFLSIALFFQVGISEVELCCDVGLSQRQFLNHLFCNWGPWRILERGEDSRLGCFHLSIHMRSTAGTWVVPLGASSGRSEPATGDRNVDSILLLSARSVQGGLRPQVRAHLRCPLSDAPRLRPIVTQHTTLAPSLAINVLWVAERRAERGSGGAGVAGAPTHQMVRSGITYRSACARRRRGPVGDVMRAEVISDHVDAGRVMEGQVRLGG